MWLAIIEPGPTPSPHKEFFPIIIMYLPLCTWLHLVVPSCSWLWLYMPIPAAKLLKGLTMLSKWSVYLHLDLALDCALFDQNRSQKSRNIQTFQCWLQLHDARRKHNCWATNCSRVCTGVLCFPFLLSTHFLYHVLEWIYWRWNCALNMLQTHLNFNESLAFLFGNSAPFELLL